MCAPRCAPRAISRPHSSRPPAFGCARARPRLRPRPRACRHAVRARALTLAIYLPLAQSAQRQFRPGGCLPTRWSSLVRRLSTSWASVWPASRRDAAAARPWCPKASVRMAIALR